MAIIKVLLIPNLTRSNTKPLLEKIILKLRQIGCLPLLSNQFTGLFQQVTYGDSEDLLKQCDLLLTVGGDGTILHSAKQAMFHQKPILGINSGRLGYLAQLEPEEINYLERLVSEDYEIVPRMMLEMKIAGDSKSYYALNDVVISKGDFSRLVDLELLGDGQPVGQYRADGLIFATPTGSTAYSLSAGGPIVDPCIDTILLTPICPHSLRDRSVLLSPKVKLEVYGKYVNNHDHLVVSVDGDRVQTLHCDQRVEICRSEQTVKFLQFSEKNFNGILNEKLKSWV